MSYLVEIEFFFAKSVKKKKGLKNKLNSTMKSINSIKKYNKTINSSKNKLKL